MPKVALLGNPNCGKTTIFNALTGARQHVGNYPGVTVESKSGVIHTERGDVLAVDLPGVYRLGGGAPEERVVTESLSGKDIDLIVNVVDSTNLDRHLYLTLQLWHFSLPVILVMNMTDEAESQGLLFDVELLEKLLGVRIVRTSGSRGEGIETLKRMIASVAFKPGGYEHPKPMPYGVTEEAVIEEMKESLRNAVSGRDPEPESYLAEKLLEGDQEIVSRFEQRGNEGRAAVEKAALLRRVLTERDNLPAPVVFADRRYGYISGLVREVLLENRRERLLWTDRLDSVATHRWFGIPLFLVAMYVVFYVTFTLGDPLVGWTETFFEWLGAKAGSLLSDSPQLQSLVCDGVLGGVGGVLSFIPTILILFLFIALLEESGYMARAAFIMDRFMHKMGLHGKSFIPMLIGFGCTVPAMMATRSIESRRDRLATIFVLPLMSCGARLPIFVLFITALFPEGYQAEILWCFYLIGILLAVSTARVLKSTLFKGGDELFIMELPPYRMPSSCNLMMVMWQRALMYLKKAGGMILFASVILWFLNTHPGSEDETVRQEDGGVVASAQVLEHSYSASIGRFFEPLTQYAGMDWKTNSALIGAFAAKEIFVAQLGILYAVPEGAQDDSGEKQALLRREISTHYSPLQGICLMLVCLIAMPCMATVATMKKESGSWLFTLGNVLFLNFMGLFLAILVYQIGLRL
ncbi:ferrous iron transport protein B [Akkermansia sp. N21116]|uniref:ferrous iron transport protein B n=1 Tax=Akkermansia sp. N21116 TaxID=3040764 RepID=UPI002AC8F610|nr:ferrous iron transport protein B [Akkermansia sp. N21116]WPX40073.1 ferrous iron transport protein B [Akkermansia sp. N21116]